MFTCGNIYTMYFIPTQNSHKSKRKNPDSLFLPEYLIL